jgi:hypothetical protein
MSQRKERPHKLVKNKTSGKFDRVTVKDKEVRETIMKAYGLKDEKDYKKFYDVQRNKIYTYNSFVGQKNGIKSVQTHLYAVAKSKLKYGADYKPSKQQELLNAMPAYSKTKGAKIAASKGTRSFANVNNKFNEQINKTMGKFIEAHSGTKDHPSIVDQINEKYKDDGAKRMKALSAYADALKNTRRKEDGSIESDYGGFPVGASAGSDEIDVFEFEDLIFQS